MKHFIWLSFDLGVNGDYQGMYRWMDAHKAKECGDNIACLEYEHQGDLLADIKADIESAVTIDQKSRVYIIRLNQAKVTGKFIIGNRRNAPWAGFAGIGDQAEDSNV
jgi:hypothetical protein